MPLPLSKYSLTLIMRILVSSKKSRLLVGVVSLVTFLAGCAMQPQTPAHMVQKATNKEAIEATKSLLITYRKPKFVISDRGGVGVSRGGWGGLFALALLPAEIASKATAAKRTEENTKKYNAAIAEKFPQENIHKEFAEKLAAAIKKRGVDAATLQIEEEQTVGPTAAEKLETHPSVDAYPAASVLDMRISLGYAADAQTDAYQPIVSVEYVLKNPSKKVLMANTQTWVPRQKGTYQTFSGLMGEYEKTYEILKTELLNASEVIDRQIFDMSDMVKKPVK